MKLFYTILKVPNIIASVNIEAMAAHDVDAWRPPPNRPTSRDSNAAAVNSTPLAADSSIYLNPLPFSHYTLLYFPSSPPMPCMFLTISCNVILFVCSVPYNFNPKKGTPRHMWTLSRQHSSIRGENKRFKCRPQRSLTFAM